MCKRTRGAALSADFQEHWQQYLKVCGEEVYGSFPFVLYTLGVRQDTFWPSSMAMAHGHGHGIHGLAIAMQDAQNWFSYTSVSTDDLRH